MQPMRSLGKRCGILCKMRPITPLMAAAFVRMVKKQARVIAERRGLGIEVLKIREENPVPLDPGLLRVTETICQNKGIDYEIMPSGAGHDAMQMAKITPAAMIFVPSRRGISHNPLEWTDPDDIALGAQLLMETLIRVANEKF